MILKPESNLAERIREKQFLLRRGDVEHGEIRLAYVACGGNMMGAFGGGVMIGLELLGLSHTADVMVGVSAGAANLAYLLSQQAVLGTSIYYDNLVRREFINPYRLWKMVDIDYSTMVIGSEKSLNIEALRASRSQFYTVATTLDGDMHMLDAKAAGVDTLTAIKASKAIPILYNRPVELNGITYLDGVASACLPVRETIERFSSTDMLVILNTPWGKYRERSMAIERIASKLTMGKFSSKLRDGFLNRDDFHNRAIDYMMSDSHTCNIGVIAPDYEISKFTRDPNIIREIVMMGVRKVWEIFGEGAINPDDVFI